MADRDALRREMEELWSFHLRRLRTGVPVRELYDRAVFSQPPALGIVRCTACGTLRRSPAESAGDLVHTYAAERVDAERLDGLRDSQRKFHEAAEVRLRAALGGCGTGLEVGSYAGGFLDVARERGWRFRGVDVNDAVNETVRARGHDVVTGDLAAATRDVPDHGLDTVAIWNCFDQLAAPEQTLLDVARVLRPGGVVVVRVPNGAFYHALRGDGRDLAAWPRRAILARNNLLAFPYRHGFTPSSVERLLSAAGFDIVRRRGDTLVATTGPWSRPWARWEERILRGLTCPLAVARFAPWIEAYGRRVR